MRVGINCKLSVKNAVLQTTYGYAIIYVLDPDSSGYVPHGKAMGTNLHYAMQ